MRAREVKLRVRNDTINDINKFDLKFRDPRKSLIAKSALGNPEGDTATTYFNYPSA